MLRHILGSEINPVNSAATYLCNLFSCQGQLNRWPCHWVSRSDFWFQLRDFCETFERLLRDFWETFETLLRDFWETFGRLLWDFWETIERRLWDFWETFMTLRSSDLQSDGYLDNKSSDFWIVLSIMLFRDAGVYILPKNWFFYKSLFGDMIFL